MAFAMDKAIILWTIKIKFMRNFREYDFWKDSMTLAKDVYIVTKDFPRYDGISNQI